MLDVLYIEDNKDEISIFARLLKKIEQPYTVQLFQTGGEALNYLLEQGPFEGQLTFLPKLVMVDLNLPGLNGFEVLQQLRAHKRTKFLSIVVYSTSENPMDIRRAYELGVNAYVIKPGGYRALGQTMQRVLDFWVNENRANPYPGRA